MTKTFFEVFPTLSLPEGLRDTAEHISVTNVVMPRSRDRLDIYAAISEEIISKKNQNLIQAHVKNQFFAANEIIVKLNIKFNVGDMTLRQAYDAYCDSLMEEAKETDHMLFNVLRKANISFTGDNSLAVEIENSDFSKSYIDSVKDLFNNVFRGKFGISAGITVRAAGEEIKVKAKEVETVCLTTDFGHPAAADMTAAAANSPLPDEPDLSVYVNHRKSADKTGRRQLKGRPKRLEDGYGREFNGDPIALSTIKEEMGEVVVRGDIIQIEERTLSTGNLLFTFVITDYTDSIKVKLFSKEGEADNVRDFFGKTKSVILKGDTLFDKFDREVTISHVVGIKKEESVKKAERTDSCEVKRVELHCHTKMSDMDAVSSVGEILKRAEKFGHKAIAITDHGVVQAFPDALKEIDRNGLKIKVIYGCEGYLVDDKPGDGPSEVKSGRRYHIIILAKNEIGRINLYRLVSESHLTYFNKRPRIPRSLLMKYREGLILGSACEAGEVFSGLVEHESEEEMKRRVEFYDYLEIQPIANNAFMLRKGGEYKTNDDLRELNRRVLRLGDLYGKKVVGTCDVHFLNPEDEVYRRIIMKGQGYSDADEQAPLYLRTTEEMLEEFAYLGRERAEEIVITNTNLIADCCDRILPVRLDKCPPVIAGSDEELRAMCYRRAENMYGTPLPPQVGVRLEKELNSIIGNGYAVMYIIAQRLVNRSNEDGYLVGSRGSVGSSLAATMAGITEVNPLTPHYRCGKCKYSDFESEEVKAYAGMAGVDMPDRLCPVCGEKLIKDGYDIPFETFLGFNGDKEPDIDLNFSGEYQSRAHAYTEELFGKGYTFKAGTVSGVAEKTAFGFVLKYFEEKGEIKRRCEIERLAKGCQDVKRTTGQHPGGIVVLPKGEEIYTFTPVQHPANDVASSIITTHFDYHAIDQNLLKLDELGHDDPTMVRRLQDLTGVPTTDIPIDDPDVMALFKDTSSIGVRPEDIGGVRLGALGIPEFGTDFAMQMVIDAQPTCVSDLVRIAGLAHGTDVWLGNAQKYILEGTATLKTAICTRDDIMLYLIKMGMDPALSFKIMESVRKGKGLKPEWEEAMLASDVPEWYIESCKKIKYMFPKAHAAAYVMMALRVAYCKVHYPIEYYTAYYSIRADGFRYDIMAMGRERLEEYLRYLKSSKDKLTDKEQLILRDARLVQEMYARGFEFMPIDIYQAKARDFRIIDGRIMPSFLTVDGMGEKAAIALEEAAKNGKFLSKEDIIQRAHISSTTVDSMEKLGIIGGLPRTNQISLFDIMLE